LIYQGIKMQIKIDQGDWGNTQIEDIKKLLENVAGQFLRYFAKQPNERIRIQCHPNEDPRILFRISPNDEYVIWLNTRDRLWSQFSYQFAHEFCHLLSGYEKFRLKTNKWFHETLCELASIFALKRMAVTWRTNPPYPSWTDYVQALKSYVDNIVNSKDNHLPKQNTLKDWFQAHAVTLRSCSRQRHLNRLVAVQLLPLFRNTPEHWQCIIYMPESDEIFTKYLALWKMNSPQKHKVFISQISNAFGITLP